MAAFCQASEVHDSNVLKIFSEAENIPKGIWSKYEYNFTVRKTLEAKILGKWACMTFAMCSDVLKSMHVVQINVTKFASDRRFSIYNLE